MKKHIWDDMPAGPSCPKPKDSDESSFNDDEPTPSEEEYFSSDFTLKDTSGWQKPITRTQQRMFEELENYTYEPWDGEETLMRKKKQRCTILSAYRDVLLNKRAIKAITRLSLIKQMKFDSRDDEAYHLLNLEIVDKKLNRPYYYSDEEPAVYRLLLQKRRRAIKRKYDEYKLTSNFYNTLEKRVYGSLAQQKNIFYEGDDDESSSTDTEDEAERRRAEDSFDRHKINTIPRWNATVVDDTRKKERRREQRIQQGEINKTAPGKMINASGLNVSFGRSPIKPLSELPKRMTSSGADSYIDIDNGMEFESYIDDGKCDSPYDMEKIFGKEYDEYKGIDKSKQKEWGDLNLSDIMNEGSIKFDDTINTTANRPPSIPLSPPKDSSPKQEQGQTTADQITEKYKKLIKDDYYPGAIDDAVNKLHDFNKLVFDIDSNFANNEDIDEQQADEEKKPLSLIAAFDLRVKFEQDQMKKSFMPMPVSDMSLDWTPKRCDASGAEVPPPVPSPDKPKSPESILINREELLRASAAAIDIRNAVREEPENDVLRAIGCLHRAETMNEYDKTVQAAEEAAQMAPPEYAEKAAVYGARTFRTEKVEKKSANIEKPGYKPLEIISYIGMTRPLVENAPNY